MVSVANVPFGELMAQIVIHFSQDDYVKQYIREV